MCDKHLSAKLALLSSVFNTDDDPPHGVSPAGFFRLQNPGLAVNAIQYLPEFYEGVQNQHKLVVEVLQSTLPNQTRTSKKQLLILKTSSLLPNLLLSVVFD